MRSSCSIDAKTELEMGGCHGPSIPERTSVRDKSIRLCSPKFIDIHKSVERIFIKRHRSERSDTIAVAIIIKGHRIKGTVRQLVIQFNE